MRWNPGAPKSRVNALSSRPMSSADVIRGGGGAGGRAGAGVARDTTPDAGGLGGAVVLAAAGALAVFFWRSVSDGTRGPDPVSVGGAAQEALISAVTTAAQWSGFVKTRRAG